MARDMLNEQKGKSVPAAEATLKASVLKLESDLRAAAKGRDSL